MSLITDWNADKAARFTADTLGFEHRLHARGLASDAALADLLDRYPRQHLGVFTMGADPVDWRSWRRGTAGDLSGAELIAAVKAGRIWLNLRHTNDHLEDYAALEAEIATEVCEASGRRTFKRDLGMLISSPNCQVFYHLDVPLVMLWQLRGQKRVFVYPVEEPYVSAPQLERIVLKESAEQFAFDPAWDAGAQAFDLTPGKMVAWAQNGPHRIENGPMLNVSLSIEFMTPAALMRANVLYANGLLRKAGLNPRIQSAPHPAALAKVGLARAWKAAGLARSLERTLPITFDLREGVPGALPDAA